MNQFIILFIICISLSLGSIFGYFARQSIAKKQLGSIEERLRRKIEKVNKEIEKRLKRAKEKAFEIINKAKKEREEREKKLLEREKILLKREHFLDKKTAFLEEREKKYNSAVERLQMVKKEIEQIREKTRKRLENIAKLTKEQARKELFREIEKEYQKDLLERIRKLEEEGEERYKKRAKEILGDVIQRIAVNQAQELTTTLLSLPTDDLKGRIIGKEGRNIRTFEKLTGTEVLIDDTPGTIIISSFDPIRREIAKIALEKLIRDGRIQPARIEEEVEKAKEELESRIREAGERAVFEVGIIDLEPKLVEILGRLNYRTSYGQNVLLHSIEVALLSGALAKELGANVEVAKKAGLLHDIGKALDHQVEGSHIEIGMKILEKFNIEEEVIKAMKSHHGDFKPETLEAVIVQVADAISASRPGARKDTLENYLKRLENLEKIATSFEGVKKAYSLQGGREIRVFVEPEKMDDLRTKKLAKEIAKAIQEELSYPGEIKVTVIRETKVIEYAK